MKIGRNTRILLTPLEERCSICPHKSRRMVEIRDKNVYPDLSNKYHAAVAATSTPIHIPLLLHSITSAAARTVKI